MNRQRAELEFRSPPENYRIKPEEPEFQFADAKRELEILNGFSLAKR